MSKLSRKAILAVLSLVLTFVALGATTFAWFSLGTTATVEQFNVNVKGSEGLEINFDGKGGWYTTLNTDRMKEFLYGKVQLNDNDEPIPGSAGVFLDGKLDAVTSSDGTSFKKMTTITKNEENKGVIGLGDAEANTEYLEFKLNFRTKLADHKLNLTKLTLTSTATPWIPDIDYVQENGSLAPAGVSFNIFPHYAARVSLTGTTTSIFQAPTDASNIAFSPDKGAHDYVAKKNGADGLVIPAGVEDYVNAPAANTSVTNLNPHNLITNLDLNDDYYVASVIVRVWIEGWDANTYDAIFEGQFQVGFEFELVPVTTP